MKRTKEQLISSNAPTSDLAQKLFFLVFGVENSSKESVIVNLKDIKKSIFFKIRKMLDKVIFESTEFKQLYILPNQK